MRSKQRDPKRTRPNKQRWWFFESPEADYQQTLLMNSKPKYYPSFDLPQWRHLALAWVVAALLVLAAVDYMCRVHTLAHLAVLPLEIVCGLTLVWVWFLNYFAFGAGSFKWRTLARRPRWRMVSVTPVNAESI